MRVLYVTNKGPACGVSQFGKLQSQALRGEGLYVDVWEADYPTYLPENAHTYDVIHVNFHPSTLGHLLADHFPEGPLLSAHFHEHDPGWAQGRPAPSIWTSPRFMKFSSDWASGAKFFPIPIPDYEPSEKELSSEPLIGFTGLRKDGLDWIEPICRKNGWKMSLAEGWLSLEDEIDRLSKCHLVVVHNHSGLAGQSSSVCTAVAARRPVLINSNQMLRAIWEMGGESQLYKIDDAEWGIKKVLSDIRLGIEKRPLLLAMGWSWQRKILALVGEWENR